MRRGTTSTEKFLWALNLEATFHEAHYPYQHRQGKLKHSEMQVLRKTRVEKYDRL